MAAYTLRRSQGLKQFKAVSLADDELMEKWRGMCRFCTP